jgi:glucuronoarabinoxylan endo-1,4-beta-xylanase
MALPRSIATLVNIELGFYMRFIHTSKSFVVFCALTFVALALPLRGLAQTATINAGTVYQTMDGFGGQTWIYADSLTGSNADLFFSRTAGIGLEFVRTANTWDGGIPDLTTLQSAVARGAKVELGLQSPPCNLKHSFVDLGESCSQSGDSGMQPLAFRDGTAGSNGNCFANRLSLDGSGGAYQQYATYIVNLIDAYQNSTNNVPIAYLDVQNESSNGSSSLGACLWMNGAQFDDFVKNYLGPALSTAGLHPTVMLGSLCCWSGDVTSECLNDSSCAQYVGIAANHGYPYPAYPSAYTLGITGGRHLWMSETSDSSGFDPSMTSALEMAQNIHQFLTIANVSAYEWWELAYQSSSGNFGLTDQSYNTTKRLWATGNWSRFVRSGWVVIGATANPQSGVYVTAFKDPSSGNFAIVAINANSSSLSQPFSLSGLSASSVIPYITDPNNNLAGQSVVSISGSSFTTTLTASSVTTFVASAAGPLPPSNLSGTVE